VQVTDIGVQAQVVDRRPDRFQLQAVDRGVDVLVDRGAADDLGDLVALVVVVEAGGVQHQAAAEQGVLRSQLDGVDEFRRELRLDAGADRGRRVGAAALVALGIEGVEQVVVGQLVVEAEAAGQLVEDRLFGRRRGALLEADAGRQQHGVVDVQALVVVGAAQAQGELQLLVGLPVQLAEDGVRLQVIGRAVVIVVVAAAVRRGVGVDADAGGRQGDRVTVGVAGLLEVQARADRVSELPIT
jgi:hypothetical protein